MTELVLKTSTLPEPLLRLIATEKVKVSEAAGGEFRIIPIIEAHEGFPLRGMFADGKISTEKFMKDKQIEKGFEG
jgi:hypothetical protein